MKLLMENWRSYLTEQEEDAKIRVKTVLDEPDYENYVGELGQAAKDPRVLAVLGHGRSDGQRNDEKVHVKNGGGSCTQFKPIQNEIDLSKSLGYPATNSAKLVPKILAGGTITATDLGGDPIISAINTYIVDGHHRWSQIYMINPNAKIATKDLGIADPEVALRVTQTAIAVIQKQVSSQKVEPGLNVFEMTDDQIKEWMLTNFSEDFIQTFIANSDVTDVDGIVTRILDNIHQMKENNAPVTDISRTYMPQTGDTDTINKELSALKAGDINFKEPF